jgi:hypothetical protein
MTKNNVLIIFKYPHPHWNIPVINQFSNFYNTEHLYLSDYKNENFTQIINKINNLIESKNIEITVFDVDYFRFINFFFIEKIKSNKKVLITGDDFELHELNSITASACDIVLSHCPLSVLKYKEKGFEAYNMQYEYNPKEKLVDKASKNKKEIDVLFFGNLTPDRINILNFITDQGIALKNIGYKTGKLGKTEEELFELISKTKIILDLSKSRNNIVKNYSSENIYKFFYVFKARINRAGLNNVACVAEYSPGLELLYNEDEVPRFFTKEECVTILKNLLSDSDLLEKYTNKLSAKTHYLCNEKISFKHIYHALEKSKFRKVELIKFPYWYLRIAAKQIILRNINLLTFFKNMRQFGIILSLIKNSNLSVKILILSESILNMLWYTLLLTFKQKK